MHIIKFYNRCNHSISCKYQKHNNQTIFQLYPNSPQVTCKDVRNALRATKRMKPYERLKYFHKRGMHYSRCVKFVNVVENLQNLYEQNAHNQDHIVTIYEYDDDKPISIQDIGAMIDEILKEMEDN